MSEYGNAVYVATKDGWSGDEFAEIVDILCFNVTWTAKRLALAARRPFGFLWFDDITFEARPQGDTTIVEWRGYA